MKTDVKGVLTAVEAAVESLIADAGDKEWTPQLGAALGGLRTAKAGLEAHMVLRPDGPEKTDLTAKSAKGA